MRQSPIDKYNIQPDDLPPEFREVADAIGMDAAMKLVRIRGGEGLYIPKAEKIARAARDRAIRAEFDGTNHRELARRYDLTVSWIYVILANDDRDSEKPTGVDVIDNQLALF